MSVIGSNIIAGASGTVETGYQIARSLRFNSADSAYLGRTPASNGNRKTWTLVFWYKRSKLGTDQVILSTPYSTNTDGIRFESTDTLRLFSNDANNMDVRTTRVFRDVGAHAMYVVSVDTTQATASNRVKMYMNNEQITAFATATYPSLNYDFNINAATGHNIGRNITSGTQFLDGYITEMRFIDGQSLDPTSFGETDANTGVWVPKAYTGTYGTNGFWLKFDDNSGTTATTLGKDSSGNGNNWTPNNFSVTAGVGNDSLVDSPTNYGTDTGAGGEVRGNYATLSPLDNGGNTLTNGNLQITDSGAWKTTRATIAMSSGKWYWEVTPTSAATVFVVTGIATAAATLTGGHPGFDANGWGYAANTGNKITNNVGSAYGATYTTNDVVGIAFDADAGTLTFYKNGVSQGTAYTGLTSGPYFPAIGTYNSTAYINFGQRPFAYTAPSGFKALCTTNLPTPAIGASASTLANKYFDADAYTGNGSTNARTLGFQPDLLWFKLRSGAANHVLIDAIRGTNLFLNSNTTNADQSATDQLLSFNSNGYTLGANTTGGNVNVNGSTYIGWAWNAGGSTVTNTNGTISSQVRANAAAGISVVTYTGNGSAGATIGHGLGVTPAMVIFKNRSATFSWAVFHKAITTQASGNVWDSTVVNIGSKSGGVTQLNLTNAAASYGMDGQTNGNGNNHVAYCFAEVAGFSKFGSFTGNGSADGAFVYCGFRPRWVLVKSTGVENWIIHDTARDDFNVTNKELIPNSAGAEGTTTPFDILSNGFKMRAVNNALNASGQTYIFAAFAEAPFNYARAR